MKMNTLEQILNRKQPEIADLCDKAEFCDYEREILLCHYCEPRTKILALDLSTKDNFLSVTSS